jgi:hypothetical protein
MLKYFIRLQDALGTSFLRLKLRLAAVFLGFGKISNVKPPLLEKN